MNFDNWPKVFTALFAWFVISANACFASSLEQYLNYNDDAPKDSMIIALSREPGNFDYAEQKYGNESCGIDMAKAHKYLGYGTLLMAVAAGVSGGDNAFHKGAGVSTALLGIATCATGFYAYGNYFDLKEGFSKHNIHIALGTLATAGFVATAASALNNDDSSHAGLGVGSTALIVIPIIVVKF